jgi:hypothetical protein
MGGIFGGGNRRVLRAFFGELEGENAQTDLPPPGQRGLTPMSRNTNSKMNALLE